MKPGARRHGDQPQHDPSPVFDAAVAWAREHYGITKAPITEWDRWRGEPMESVMRITWHAARLAGERHPTKKTLAARFGLSPSCTAAYNAGIPPMPDEEEAIKEIVAKLTAPPEPPPKAAVALIAVGRGRKWHFQTGTLITVEGKPDQAKANCGPVGTVVWKEINEGDELCSRCCWLGDLGEAIDGVVRPGHEPKR